MSRADLDRLTGQERVRRRQSCCLLAIADTELTAGVRRSLQQADLVDLDGHLTPEGQVLAYQALVRSPEVHSAVRKAAESVIEGLRRDWKVDRGGQFKIALPLTGAPFTVEWVLAVPTQGSDQARIMSVVRYGAACQFGDVVRLARGREGPEFVEIVTPGGYVLHRIHGGEVDRAQAHRLEQFVVAALDAQQEEVTISAWSAFMDLGEGCPQRAPLVAGLVIRPGQEPAAHAVAVLRAAGEQLGLQLWYPTLLNKAGDQINSRHHERVVRKLAGLGDEG